MGELKSLNFKFIIHIIGAILLFEGLFMSISLIYAFSVGAYEFRHILLASIITSGTGITVFLITNKNLNRELQVREGFILVSFSWIIICLFGTLPYVFNRSMPSFIDALFETVSGFTTTGASILTDIEAVPKGILLWRSSTHWLGGMGIIVLALAVLPILKFGGTSLFSAESSVVVQEKIQPRIIEVAKRLWGIYILLTVVEILLLCLGKMPLFDSVCHAFGTIATGGFSTKNTSIGGYSPYIQYVIMIFMFLAGINFIMHYFIFRGRLKEVIKNEELRVYFFIVLIVGLVVSLILIFKEHYKIEESIRLAYFQVISIITATGFATADYLVWPVPAWVIIFFLMFVGACAGSTGGGIKVIRHVILFKRFSENIKQALHPQGVFITRYNGRPVSADLMQRVMAFIFFYLLVFSLGTVFMIVAGLDMESAAGSVITCLGGIGPGIGTVGPAANFAHVSVAGKIFLSFIMLLGRLEMYSLIVVLTPTFWIA